ncbi:site-specific tyrosine recombinase XerC [Posidoniimonas corsicana]|uniref:Site-specific tyrosine recombinase XerC n=1 Tax=Posidoniimonas corsicana TaxID=1938618 RepID=A0A5C5VBR9_9BACT|nr:site-specific integrase [Posidoniimonas corsicana]TWT35162.1 site-specific tyrosine recombinase XerC [Posidoniimonas corsicana]
MPARRIPSYRRQKSRNLAVVRIDGRDVYLGPYDSPESHAKYDRLIADWLRRQQVTLNDVVNLTAAELMAAYLTHAREYYVKNGELTREFGCITEALREVRPLHGETLVADFGPKALKAVRERMIEVGWSRRYINKQVGRVLRMFKWGVAEELVPPAVHLALATVPGLRKGRTAAPDLAPVQPVADELIEKTLKHLPPMIADMVRLQRLSGARPGEIVGLRPIDIDQSTAVWAYRPDSHKTEHHERSRVVFFGPKSQQVLKPYLDRPLSACCFSPAESEAQRRLERHLARVTPIKQGNKPGSRPRSSKRVPKDAYTTDSYRRAIHRACEKHGLLKWSPNRIRHTAATEIRKRYGLEAAQTVLGHSTADVTQIYAERDMALASSIAAELG